MTMPIASRLGVPVFRKKSEKYSIVSIREFVPKKMPRKFLLNYIRKAGLPQWVQHPVLMESICGVLIS
jgi:hypothetical protein